MSDLPQNNQATTDRLLENPDPSYFKSLTVVDQWFPIPGYVAQRIESVYWDDERRTFCRMRLTREHPDGPSEWWTCPKMSKSAL